MKNIEKASLESNTCANYPKSGMYLEEVKDLRSFFSKKII